MSFKKEFGDYQTPLIFAQQICSYLKDYKCVKPTAVLEPSCGIGNFLKSSLIFDATEFVGIEINPEYCDVCRKKLADHRVKIINQSFFNTPLHNLFNPSSSLLIIGNPPWVTSSTLSVLESTNMPLKINFKGLRGIDAFTGSGGFDICENMILKLLNEYQGRDTTLALLCKTTTARSVFAELMRCGIRFQECEIVEFDAAKVFRINAAACLFFVKLSTNSSQTGNSQHTGQYHHADNSHHTDNYYYTDFCKVRSMDDVNRVKAVLRCKNGSVYVNGSAELEEFDGRCCFEWRQGVKHDCSKVMELKSALGQAKTFNQQDTQNPEKLVSLNREQDFSSLKNSEHDHSHDHDSSNEREQSKNIDGQVCVCLENGYGELVEIEPDAVYPLIKGSRFKQPLIHDFDKYVLVTQKKLREPTAHLSTQLPRTWAYLQVHREEFMRRKSSIYQNAPEFSMFGIGDYAFAPYKVGISGFAKRPLFAVLTTENLRPVMLDDTGYYLTFTNYELAYTAMLMLNSAPVQHFIQSLAFVDSKRPYTKKLLSRLDFGKMLEKLDLATLQATERSLHLKPFVTDEMYQNFGQLVHQATLR